MSVSQTTTFVSAFVKDINHRSDRTIDDYMKLGEHLLNTPFHKIIFIDKGVYETHIAEKAHHYPTTYFVQIEKPDIYLYKHKEHATDFRPITNNPEKDTYEFFMVQCMKTEWVKQAIEMNVFESEQFAWIDFGVYHFIDNDKDLMDGMRNMACKEYANVRIANTNPPDFPYYSRNVIRHIIWMFAGSVFGGNKHALTKFAEAMREKCLMFIEDYKTLTWEINLWYLIFFENQGLFDLYDTFTHDKEVLTNY
jgi:hypothetical protein